MAEKLTRLDPTHRAILEHLNVRPIMGALTGGIADKLHRYQRTAWATTRCKTMAKHGLVRRHETNAERWFITDAGRAALDQEGGRDG